MDDELKGLAAQFDAIYSQAYGEIIPLVIKAIWSGQESTLVPDPICTNLSVYVII
jgi:hypothetical protein